MARCQNITPKRKQICIGALRNRLDIYDRNIVGVSVQNTAEHNQDFTLATSVFASIETRKGGATQTMDGVVIDPNLIATHTFISRYISTITTEQFIVMNGLLYGILKTENIDEANLWLRMTANLRGSFTKPGAQ